MKIQIVRKKYEDVQTLGEGVVVEKNEVLFSFKTLELPWLDNQRKISCIPKGYYLVKKRYSKKYGHHFHITEVEGRTWILIHFGNYYRDTLGCILVGKTLADIDGDGYRDVTHSKQTMNRLNELLPNEFDLWITDNLGLTT